MSAAIGLFGILSYNIATSSASTPATSYNMDPACSSPSSNAQSSLVAPFKSIVVLVNGNTVDMTWRDLNGHGKTQVKAGDTITVKATIKDQCAGTYLGLSTYERGSQAFSDSNQKLYQRDDIVMKAGQEAVLTATLPDCFFQFDVNTGREYVPGDYTLDNAGRLIYTAWDNGVGTTCTKSATTPVPTTPVPTTPVPTTPVPSSITSSTPKPVVIQSQLKVSAECRCDLNPTPAADEKRDGVIVTFDNTTGKKSETVYVGVDNTYSTTAVVIAAGEKVQRIIPTERVATVNVKVKNAQGTVLYNQNFKLNCAEPAPVVKTEVCETKCTVKEEVKVLPQVTTTSTPQPKVLPQMQTPAPQLATTGWDVRTNSVIGAFLVLAGLTFAIGARRIREYYEVY